MEIIEPNKWVILEIEFKSGVEYKVFGSWTGGYLDGDSWRLNSGIEKVEEDEEYFYFYGFSGSCYKCDKELYGIAGVYNRAELSNILEYTESKIMEYNKDFMKIFNQK